MVLFINLSKDIIVKMVIFAADFSFKNKKLYFYSYNHITYARPPFLLKNFTFR